MEKRELTLVEVVEGRKHWQKIFADIAFHVFIGVMNLFVIYILTERYYVPFKQSVVLYSFGLYWLIKEGKIAVYVMRNWIQFRRLEREMAQDTE